MTEFDDDETQTLSRKKMPDLKRETKGFMEMRVPETTGNAMKLMTSSHWIRPAIFDSAAVECPVQK